MLGIIGYLLFFSSMNEIFADESDMSKVEFYKDIEDELMKMEEEAEGIPVVHVEPNPRAIPDILWSGENKSDWELLPEGSTKGVIVNSINGSKKVFISL